MCLRNDFHGKPPVSISLRGPSVSTVILCRSVDRTLLLELRMKVSGVTCLQWRGSVNNKSKMLQNCLLRASLQSGLSAATNSVRPRRTGIM
jgi:hypothetical protein